MWEKKLIDRMEMLHILGMIYARTAAGFGKVALQKLMMEEAKPTVRAKTAIVCRALTQSGLLTYCRQKKNRLYVESQGVGTAFPSSSRRDDRADRCRGKEESKDTMEAHKNEE